MQSSIGFRRQEAFPSAFGLVVPNLRLSLLKRLPRNKPTFGRTDAILGADSAVIADRTIFGDKFRDGDAFLTPAHGGDAAARAVGR